MQNGQPFPSVSGYTDPAINADGSVDMTFGPQQPDDTQNWIATVPGRGWFPIFRFYSPTEAYFDKTWKLEHAPQWSAGGRRKSETGPRTGDTDSK